jgi:hypothetical protein
MYDSAALLSRSFTISTTPASLLHQRPRSPFAPAHATSIVLTSGGFRGCIHSSDDIGVAVSLASPQIIMSMPL